MDRARLKLMSGQLDSWISRQVILVKVAQEIQKLLIYIARLPDKFICAIYTISGYGQIKRHVLNPRFGEW